MHVQQGTYCMVTEVKLYSSVFCQCFYNFWSYRVMELGILIIDSCYVLIICCVSKPVPFLFSITCWDQWAVPCSPCFTDHYQTSTMQYVRDLYPVIFKDISIMASYCANFLILSVGSQQPNAL